MELSRPSLFLIASAVSISALLAARIFWLLLEDPQRLILEL
mgnify:CR=1 FL=1